MVSISSGCFSWLLTSMMFLASMDTLSNQLRFGLPAFLFVHNCTSRILRGISLSSIPNKRTSRPTQKSLVSLPWHCPLLHKGRAALFYRLPRVSTFFTGPRNTLRYFLSRQGVSFDRFLCAIFQFSVNPHLYSCIIFFSRSSSSLRM